MRVQDVVRVLEELAPPHLAAEGDNVGLLVGDPLARVTKALLCIDLTEAVLAEALAARAQFLVAYHPVIYRPISRLTARETPVAYQAARRGLAVYSPHTALDAAPGGTNDALAGLMGLKDCRPLEPLLRQGDRKIVVFVPEAGASAVSEAAFAAGAGRIGNYSECSFFCRGAGTFRGGAGAHPAVGRAGRRERAEEARLEVIAPASRAADVCAAIRHAHPYETPAIDVYPLEGFPPGAGMGRVGEFARLVPEDALIARVKKAAGLARVWVARGGGPSVPVRGSGSPRARGGRGRTAKTAACGAGSCGGLWRRAVESGATFYLTGELRHHDALAAVAAGLTVVCLGHANSERPVLAPLAARLRRRLPGLAIGLAVEDRNPLEIA
jgi:dinuclear metal center YbgI/SA1388 family protein